MLANPKWLKPQRGCKHIQMWKEIRYTIESLYKHAEDMNYKK